MNRIFYDSISDLPSGGGEQEGGIMKLIQVRADDAYNEFKEKFIDLSLIVLDSRQSEIDSLKEQLRQARSFIEHVSKIQPMFFDVETVQSDAKALLNQQPG